MNLRAFKDRLLAAPFVYNHIRPIVVGGLKLQTLADFCDISSDDRVFDLGCGTARLLKYLHCARYLGADMDPVAIANASRFATPDIQFIAGDGWDAACREFCPTVALMIGVVHHVSDESFQILVDRMRSSSDALRRLTTIEVTYFPKAGFNNLMSRLDRGRNVRKPEEYERLFDRCGLRIIRTEILPTRLGLVRYVGYHLLVKD